MLATNAQLAPVHAWSLALHGPGRRHDWCMVTATAMIEHTELPHPRGYSPTRFATGLARRETIARMIGAPAGHTDPDAPTLF